MFTFRYGVSPKRVNTALNKLRSETSMTDVDAQEAIISNKLKEESVQKVIVHIRKIPKYKSHYCRVKTDREFLLTYMTLQVMYDLYKIDTQNPVSLSKYKEVFYSNFNLTRKQLNKDTCNFCNTISIQISNSRNEEERTKLNNEKKSSKIFQLARSQLHDDTKKAQDDQTIETFTFNLEKTLPLPGFQLI